MLGTGSAGCPMLQVTVTGDEAFHARRSAATVWSSALLVGECCGCDAHAYEERGAYVQMYAWVGWRVENVVGT